MPENYSWKIIDFEENKNQIKQLFEQIEALKYYPAANHWQYLFPIIENYFDCDKMSFAILYHDKTPTFIMPISIFSVSKFIFRWHEIGYPFHKHINLIRLPNELIDTPAIIENLMHIAKIKYGNNWSRFSIRNIETSKSSHEYCGDVSYFKTDERCDIHDVISKKHIRNLKRIDKKLIEDIGNYNFSINSPSLTDSLDQFIEFEGKSWKGMDGVAISSNLKLSTTYCGICKNFNEKTMFIAKIQSKGMTLSSALGFQLGVTLYIHKISHSNEYSKYAPGSILILKLLEHSIKTINIINMNLVTSPEWAKRWHPRLTKVINIVHFNDNFTGKLLKIIIFSWRKYKPTIKSLLKIS